LPAPATGRPRLLQGRVRDLPEGSYRVELDIPALADKLTAAPPEIVRGQIQRDTFTVLPPESGEMYQLATNRPLLEALSVRSGGEVLTPETAERLRDLLAQRVIRRTLRDEQKLWQDQPLVWYVLGAFVGLLTLEWVGRKLAGLP
jgi:hypothetical protein